MAELATVGIGDFLVSASPDTELITYSLGSCIGLTVWDPKAKVGGMLHYMLPNSKLAPAKAKTRPAMFADTGIPLLFQSVYRLGAKKERLVVKAAGGSSLFETSEQMNIGLHNYQMLRGLLDRNGVRISGEHVGSTISRTMRLNIDSGSVSIENRKIGRLPI